MLAKSGFIAFKFYIPKVQKSWNANAQITFENKIYDTRIFF